MEKLSVYDLVLLRNHFANKKKPTADEKAALEKLDRHLLRVVEDMVYFNTAPEIAATSAARRLAKRRTD
jgi:hypothetical protein